MESRPTFSIIVPVFNRAEQLFECIEALRHLDCPAAEFEVIVADDGSEPPVQLPDPGPQDKLTIRLVRSPRNEGPASARNRGAACARGSYLAFLDDDCLPGPAWLRQIEQRFAEAPDSVIGGRMLDGSPGNPYSAASAAITREVYRHYNADPDRARFFASANLAVPASVFRRIGGFHIGFRVSEDREFCEHCRRNGVRLVYAPGAAVVHKETGGFQAFWRRHYSYGRGAYRFRKRKATGGESGIRLESGNFYWRMLCAPFIQERNLRAFRLTALVWTSQLASALGFLAEWRQSRSGPKE